MLPIMQEGAIIHAIGIVTWEQVSGLFIIR